MVYIKESCFFTIQTTISHEREQVLHRKRKLKILKLTLFYHILSKFVASNF